MRYGHLRYTSNLFSPQSIAGFPTDVRSLSPRSTNAGVRLSPCVSSLKSFGGHGISTVCASTTPLGLALGPDLPRADEPSSGNLGFSVRGILTHVSLLTPAFSLLCAPRLLTVPLRRVNNAPLPITCVIPQLRCRVSAPDIFGAGPLD